MNKHEQAGRKYLFRFSLAMGGYVLLLIVFVVLIDRVEQDALRIALALLPVLPVLLGTGAYIQFLRNMDEMQRRLTLEGLAISVALTGSITFALGFLDIAGYPTLHLIWVFPMLMAFWGIGRYVASLRYR